jgi:hypothetical protein
MNTMKRALLGAGDGEQHSSQVEIYWLADRVVVEQLDD